MSALESQNSGVIGKCCSKLWALLFILFRPHSSFYLFDMKVEAAIVIEVSASESHWKIGKGDRDLSLPDTSTL